MVKRLAAVVGVVLAGCSAGRPIEEPRDRTAPLVELESELRARDFSSAPARELGPDPVRIASLPSGALVGLSRGRNELSLLSPSLETLVRAEAPDGAGALAIAADGTVLVAGKRSNEVFHYRVEQNAFFLIKKTVLVGAVGVDSLTDGFALDALGERIHRLRDGRTFAVGRGAFEIRVAPEGLYVLDAFDHSLELRALDDQASLRKIEHDGPIWSFDRRDGYVALGGVEDHALDRTIGSFGYIDSFIFVYRPTRHGFERVAAVNVSEHGLVTPKVVRWTDDGKLDVWGYGSAARLTLAWNGKPEGEPRVTSTRSVPGIASMIALGDGYVGANPLLDAWIVERDGESHAVALADRRTRSVDSKLGEALFFTTLMAPKNRSDGPLSRFTCETCHFDGATDGRIHHTGRRDVRVTTKPLFGLVENRPYFSRALDTTLAELVDNEFRAAGKGSGTDPWFSIATDEFPWLRQLGVEEDELDAVDLRRALMQFIAGFGHEPNPFARGKTRFDEREARGARLFFERCESCHEARLLTDDASTRVSFDRWESLTLTRGGPIVWATERYQKTGVEPYVHTRGTRVPSLRRTYLKAKYLTNGSAPSMEAAIDATSVGDAGFLHVRDRAVPPLFSVEERRALAAFLRLL